MKSSIFLGLAVYLLLFSNFPGYEIHSQVGALIMAGVSATIAAFIRGIPAHRLTVLEILLLVACAGSLFSSAYSGLSYSILYTFTFIAAILMIATAVRSIPLQEILRVTSIAYLAMLITISFAEFEGLAIALNVNSENRWAIRFQPFGMHPNLTGFVFGGGSILLLYMLFTAKSIGIRLIYLSGSLLAFLIILAASARGSLVALAVSGLLISIAIIKNGTRKTQQLALGVLFLTTMGSVFYWEQMYDYLSEILELNSDTRGVDSGGTGRTELWSMGISLLSNGNFLDLLLGKGLRSASPENIGFSTENSYITIMLESGILLGTALLACILIYAALITKRAAKSPPSAKSLHFYLAATFIFVLTQSIFNRYLIGIGNPLSLLFLLLAARTGLIVEGISELFPRISMLLVKRRI